MTTDVPPLPPGPTLASPADDTVDGRPTFEPGDGRIQPDGESPLAGSTAPTGGAGAVVVGTAVIGTAVVGTAVVGTAVVGTPVVGIAVVGGAVVGTPVVGTAVVGRLVDPTRPGADPVVAVDDGPVGIPADAGLTAPGVSDVVSDDDGKSPAGT